MTREKLTADEFRERWDGARYFDEQVIMAHWIRFGQVEIDADLAERFPDFIPPPADDKPGGKAAKK